MAAVALPTSSGSRRGRSGEVDEANHVGFVGDVYRTSEVSGRRDQRGGKTTARKPAGRHRATHMF